MTYWHGWPTMDELLEARGWTRAGTSWRPPIRDYHEQSEAEEAWERAFASEKFAALVAGARADIAAGRTTPMNPDDL